LYHWFSVGRKNVGAAPVLGFNAFRSGSVPATAVVRSYAPFSVVAAACAPVGCPFAIQLAKRAASNQST
jgi:hypothetical protein